MSKVKRVKKSHVKRPVKRALKAKKRNFPAKRHVSRHKTGHSVQKRQKKIKTAGKKSIRVEKEPIKKKHERKREYIPTPSEAKNTFDLITADEFALEYLKKNVSKNAVEVLKTLMTPKTDDQIADLLNMKINFVRRMLNIMQGYGITNYYIAKNNNGWLSFAWYINGTKLQTFFDYIRSMKGDEIVINDNCNDYFICNKCYKDAKLIFAFDAAYEAGFKCTSCGSKFQMIGKAEAETLINTTRAGPAELEAKQ